MSFGSLLTTTNRLVCQGLKSNGTFFVLFVIQIVGKFNGKF